MKKYITYAMTAFFAMIALSMAAPDKDALQLTIYEGTVKWLEPVTDQQYLASPKK